MSFMRPYLTVTMIGIGAILLLSLTTHEPLNPDGLLYIEAAQTYTQTGLKGLFAIYNWPLYPFLIAFAHQLTHLSYATSGKLLNIIFAMTVGGAFVSLMTQLTQDRLILWLSVLTIVLYPELNRTAQLLSRDCGYWAFALISLVFLGRLARHQRLWDGAGFGLSMLIAGLFRIEGLVLLGLLPFTLLFHPTHRASLFIKANLLALVLLGFGCLTLMMVHPHLDSLGQINRFTDPLTQGMSLWQEKWGNKIIAIRAYVLAYQAHENATPLLIGGSILIFAISIFKALGLLFFVLSAYGLRHRLITFPPHIKPIFFGFLCINFVILSLFVIQEQFVQSRYAVLFCIPLLCYVPFSLKEMRTSSRFIKILIILFLLSMLYGDLIHTGPSKAYIYDAGMFLREQQATRVYSNNPQVMFYYQSHVDIKHNVFDDTHLHALINHKQLHQYDWVAIDTGHGMTNQTLEGYRLIKTFSNSRGDKVSIFSK